MGRKTAREAAMKLIYQFLIQRENYEEQLRIAIDDYELPKADIEFIEERIRGTLKFINDIDMLIEKHAKGWKLFRMPRIDLAILRLAIYEMKYARDVPVSVSINEAVELAKKYSTEESGSFINGILGRVAGTSEENKTPGPEEIL